MQGDNNTHIIMTDKVSVRSGDDVAYVGFQILPKSDRQGFFINSSPFISVTMKETDSTENLRVLAVKGKNDGEDVKTGYIDIEHKMNLHTENVLVNQESVLKAEAVILQADIKGVGTVFQQRTVY